MKVIQFVAFALSRLRASSLLRLWGASLALLLAVYSIAASAQEQERVKLYQVDLAVATDGTLRVRETITLRVEGDEFKRGFIRDYPTRYRDQLGNLVRVSFDVVSIARNGRPEPYTTERIPNGIGLRIGSADVFLMHGDHTYRLEYETKGQIGFFTDHDELYYNAIGHGWVVPIDRADVSLRLPPGAQILDALVFTGPEGMRDSNATMSHSGNVFRAATTKSLATREGMTIAVTWPKGIVTPPSSIERTERFIGDNIAVAIGIVGLMLVMGYYLYLWDRYGRDPDGGTVIPLFAPPQNFSPAAVRFVRRMGYDRKSFAAAILSMAVKRYLEINEDDHVFTLKKLEGASEGVLTSGERHIAGKLFSRGNSIVLKDENHNAISSAISGLGESLKREFEKVYFVTNTGYFLVAVVLSLVVGALMIFLADLPEEAAGGTILMTGLSAGVGFLLYASYDGWRTLILGPGNFFLNLLHAIGRSVAALALIGLTVFAASEAADEVPWVFVLVFVALGALNFIFYHLLKAPTALGAKTRAEIEGFRMFLGTAEKERLAILHPPEITPDLFERYLPFALALDVEHEWSEQFARAAAAAGDDTAESYQPVWYHGNRWSRYGSSGFASNLGASLASATAAAASPSGRSSGFGGGGFSGGGGGGGGGRGW